MSTAGVMAGTASVAASAARAAGGGPCGGSTSAASNLTTTVSVHHNNINVDKKNNNAAASEAAAANGGTKTVSHSGSSFGEFYYFSTFPSMSEKTHQTKEVCFSLISYCLDLTCFF